MSMLSDLDKVKVKLLEHGCKPPFIVRVNRTEYDKLIKELAHNGMVPCDKNLNQTYKGMRIELHSNTL